ncbi:MAG: secondary thiamine-phosphate synthase enzyme YjbQ [Verrucomicrobiota bacterium]|nr:secondary thiamine-phosphate synthase enzyme YjbQ [Verrucomicrobiota bacterium]MEC8518012.1 secondary thiamine-phosphate synthase enzyme YjbQ [Verrucomicrobiota bacterium]
MMEIINIKTHLRTEFINIDKYIASYANKKKFTNGILSIFIPHTTAGITINENADPDVKIDMDKILTNFIPWENNYNHFEGNSAAHVKASLMGNSANVFVENTQIQLGIWQSVYFCEFDGPRNRSFWIKEN